MHGGVFLSVLLGDDVHVGAVWMILALPAKQADILNVVHILLLKELEAVSPLLARS